MLLREAGDSRVVSEMGMCCLSQIFHVLPPHMSQQQSVLISHWRDNERSGNAPTRQWFVSCDLLTLTVHTATCFKAKQTLSSVHFNYCAPITVKINEISSQPWLEIQTFNKEILKIISTCQYPGLVSNEAKNMPLWFSEY